MKFFDKIEKALDDISPGLWTGLSIVSMLATVGYAVYAGYEIGKIMADEEMPKEEKTKKVIVKSIPIVVGATFSGATGYLAHHKNAKTIATLTGAIAVSQKDNKYLKAFKERAEEKMGVKTSEEVHQEAEDVIHNRPFMDARVCFYDMESGYSCMSTKKEFDIARELYNEEFNNLDEAGQLEGLPIERFYSLWLKDDYIPVKFHADKGLKLYEVVSFRPDMSGRVMDDGTLGWQFEYEISDLREPEREERLFG